MQNFNEKTTESLIYCNVNFKFYLILIDITSLEIMKFINIKTLIISTNKSLINYIYGPLINYIGGSFSYYVDEPLIN